MRGSRQPNSGAPDLEALPELLYVPDLAALLRISPKAVRHRAARGGLPPPLRLGRALAWTRDAVLGWLRDGGRSAGSVDMKITLRPYAKDKSRWHIDIRLMNPHHPEQELRRRVVAPAGHDQKQARAWGERQVAVILRELVGERDKEADAIAPAVGVIKPTRKEAPKKTWASTTLAEFYRARFEPEHVNLLKPATRDYYRKVWNLYVAPEIGELPLAELADRFVGVEESATTKDPPVPAFHAVPGHLEGTFVQGETPVVKFSQVEIGD